DGTVNITATEKKLPDGYRVVGSEVTTNTTADGNKVITVVQKVEKIPNNSITTETVTKDGNVVGTPKTYTGLDGSKVTVRTPIVPKGYHLVTPPSTIPTTIPNGKDQTVTWTVAKDTTTINAKYIDAKGGAVVNGGTFTLSEGKASVKDGITSTTVDGTINITATETKLPDGYRVVGSEVTTNTTADGNKVITVVQKVEKIPSNSITTETITKDGNVVGTPKTYIGLDGSKVTVTAPIVPKGYHLVTPPSTIPTTIPNGKNQTIKWIVAKDVKDTTTINAKYIDAKGGAVVNGGTFTLSEGKASVKDGITSTTVDGTVNITATEKKLPDGYRVVG
ncbi:MAG: hypothetical protein ACRC0X_01815, partial [Brevinema sp.]